MSEMLDAFAPEMNRTFSVYPKGNGLDGDGEIIQGFVGAPTLSGIECAYYTGSAAESLISDQYKTVASGVIISRVVDVVKGSKIVLDTGEEFAVIFPDDVMMQGEVLVITVGSPDYGSNI